jgi:hypothetical protein
LELVGWGHENYGVSWRELTTSKATIADAAYQSFLSDLHVSDWHCEASRGYGCDTRYGDKRKFVIFMTGLSIYSEARRPISLYRSFTVPSSRIKTYLSDHSLPASNILSHAGAPYYARF